MFHKKTHLNTNDPLGRYRLSQRHTPSWFRDDPVGHHGRTTVSTGRSQIWIQAISDDPHPLRWIIIPNVRRSFDSRSLRGDKLLPAVVGLSGPSVRSAGRAALGVSGPRKKMGLRGHSVPLGRLSRGHPLGGLGLHLHVDIRRSLSRNQVERNTPRWSRAPPLVVVTFAPVEDKMWTSADGVGGVYNLHGSNVRLLVFDQPSV